MTATARFQFAADRLLELLLPLGATNATTRELAEALGVKRATTIRAIRTLEARGLLTAEYRAANAAAGDLSGRTLRVVGGAE